MEVYPFIDELRMMREEAEDDLEENPNDVDAKTRLDKVNHSIEAACVFSDELAKVPEADLKPNLMLDGSSNSLFRKSGGSSNVIESWNDNERKVAQYAVRKMANNFRAGKAGSSAPPGAPPAKANPSATRPQLPPASSAKASSHDSAKSPSKKVASTRRC